MAPQPGVYISQLHISVGYANHSQKNMGQERVNNGRQKPEAGMALCRFLIFPASTAMSPMAMKIYSLSLCPGPAEPTNQL